MFDRFKGFFYESGAERQKRERKEELKKQAQILIKKLDSFDLKNGPWPLSEEEVNEIVETGLSMWAAAEADPEFFNLTKELIGKIYTYKFRKIISPGYIPDGGNEFYMVKGGADKLARIGLDLLRDLGFTEEDKYKLNRIGVLAEVLRALKIAKSMPTHEGLGEGSVEAALVGLRDLLTQYNFSAEELGVSQGELDKLKEKAEKIYLSQN